MISIYPEYKKDYYEKYFNTTDEKTGFINKAAQVIEKVCSVIPHTIFVNTSKFDEFVYAKYIKSNIPQSDIILILTNDDVLFQLIDNHTFVLNLKGIKSQLLTSKNCISILTKKEEYNFTTALLPFVLSLSGNKKYSFKSISSVALVKACNITQHLLENGKLVDAESIEFPIEFLKLDPKNKLEKLLLDNKDQIIQNYKFITGNEIYYKNKLLISTDVLNNKQLNNKIYFAELNSKIFSMFPLQIDMILKGESLWKEKIKFYM